MNSDPEAVSFDPSEAPHLLIVGTMYRPEIVSQLVAGASARLKEAGASYDLLEVHGAYEIPAAIAMAEASADVAYDGYIALGCLLKGETIHDEVVAYPCYHALQDLAVEKHIALGNAVLTVQTLEQAKARANPDRENRGAEAASAALHMIHLKRKFGLDRK